MKKRARLDQLEKLPIAADEVYLFRQEIVDWVRDAGCQIRRVRLESPRSRPWHQADDLLQRTTTQPGRTDSSYILKMQPLSISVSGTLENVKSLLGQLRSANRLIRSTKLSMYPSRENRKQLEVDLELLLFDLTKAPAPASPRAAGRG